MTTPADSPVIDLKHVAKTYGRKVHALRGIRMQVHPGEVFGLLGPNGAGKSTLVKIMMTVVRASRALGTMLGRPVGHKPTLARIGYLPEHRRFPAYLTGRQALEHYAALANVDRRTRRRRAAELLELVGLDRWGKSKVSAYSKGMLQRLGLAQAMMNDPELIVLDEPTDALDPVGRREVRDVLQGLRDRGKTVFLNSHLLSEVERVCDRVAILVLGKVVHQGMVDDLTARSRHYEIELGSGPAGRLQEAVRSAIPVEKGTLASGEGVELAGNVVRIGTDDPARVQPIIDALRSRQLVIESVRPVRQSLEDFFIETVSGSDDRSPVPRDGEGDPP